MKGRHSDGRTRPRKDVWMVITVVILALYALFMIYPLFMLLRNAVINSGGQFTLAYFIKFLSKEYYLGTVVKIEHSDGWSTLYANLTAVPSVSAGDAVKAGQVIGAVGQTAMLEVSARPHLHLEVYRYGAVTDPALLLG